MIEQTVSNVPIVILDLGTKTNLIIYNPVQSNLFQKLVIPKSKTHIEGGQSKKPQNINKML